jgi:predicted metal-dependent HD superfamily phosphohydrolase
MDSELIRRSRSYAEAIFKDRAFEKRSFHNLGHTLDVVKAAEEIGLNTQLSQDELESVTIAGWLHDIGYVEGAKDHERKAADKARELLTEWGMPQKRILEVTEAIMATKVPQQPRSLGCKWKEIS